ncbi:MAG: hypothetical protein O2811_02405, partial [Proteobacteria bacterium]|nr:hypothetical protein [Pseudomonadota bacterium]
MRQGLQWRLGCVLGFLAVLAGCGGGGGALGDSNDGRLVIRSTVSLRGGASLGTERLLSGGQCVALTLEDQVQHQAAVDEAGAYLLLVPPSFEGRLRCNLAASSGLYLERYVDLSGTQAGDDLIGLDLSPLSTIVARRMVFDRLDGRLSAPAAAEAATLLANPPAEATQLATGLAAVYERLAETALTVDSEALMLDLFADGTA